MQECYAISKQDMCSRATGCLVLVAIGSKIELRGLKSPLTSPCGGDGKVFLIVKKLR